MIELNASSSTRTQIATCMWPFFPWNDHWGFNGSRAGKLAGWVKMMVRSSRTTPAPSDKIASSPDFIRGQMCLSVLDLSAKMDRLVVRDGVLSRFQRPPRPCSLRLLRSSYLGTGSPSPNMKITPIAAGSRTLSIPSSTPGPAVEGEYRRLGR